MARLQKISLSHEMNITVFGNFQDWLIILVVVFLGLGPKRLPDVGRRLGLAMRYTKTSNSAALLSLAVLLFCIWLVCTWLM